MALEIGKLYRKKPGKYPNWDFCIKGSSSLFYEGWKPNHIMLYLGENKFWSLYHGVKIQMTELAEQECSLEEIYCE